MIQEFWKWGAGGKPGTFQVAPANKYCFFYRVASVAKATQICPGFTWLPPAAIEPASGGKTGGALKYA